jgi:hypothetical protein
MAEGYFELRKCKTIKISKKLHRTRNFHKNVLVMFMVFRNISLILWHKIPSSEDRRFSRSGMDGFKTWKVQSKRWKRWENTLETIGKDGRIIGEDRRTIGEDGRMIGGPLEEMGERLEDHWSLIGL